MPKFRKKPVVIEATQWFKNGDHPQDNVMRPFEDSGEPPTTPREGSIVRYFRHPGMDSESLCKECGRSINEHGWLDTQEGKDGAQRVCPGNWVITGIKGERYPCKPDTFAATYEPI